MKSCIYIYFVSFIDGSTFGGLNVSNCEVSYDNLIRSISDINYLQHFISTKMCGGDSVVILNYRLLRTENLEITL